MEASKNAKLCLDWIKSIFAIQISSIRPYNNLLTMKTTTKTGKKPKNSVEKARRKCRCNLNQRLFSENIIYDPFNIFLKSTGTISNRIL